MKKIALGSDHVGFKMKETIKNHLSSRGYEIVDFGTDSEEVADYPDFCRPAAESVAKGESDCGIVFGGSGNGEVMVANKIEGIRCGLCWNVESARLTKKHNVANMISIGVKLFAYSFEFPRRMSLVNVRKTIPLLHITGVEKLPSPNS